MVNKNEKDFISLLETLKGTAESQSVNQLIFVWPSAAMCGQCSATCCSTFSKHLHTGYVEFVRKVGVELMRWQDLSL